MMYYNILKEKIRGFKLFIMVFLISMVFLKTTVYAAVPYTYAPNTTKPNTIDITFDYDISIVDVKKITIYQTSGINTMRTPKMKTPTVSGKILQIEIEQLDPNVISYAIKIEKDALKYANGAYIQLTDFIVPFSSTDIASGFKTIFMDNTQGAMDYLNKIFEFNAPRDVNVYVPKRYIISIETIHKKDGLVIPPTPTVPPALPTPTSAYTKLTNIDVKTDAAVKRLKVSITTNAGVDTLLKQKELFSNTGFAGFTTGQAGVEIDTEGKDYTITIEAFDINGKLLEKSDYNKKVQNTGIISDYITSKASANKTITLYDLMKTQATLTSMIESFSTENLDLIKVMYPNTEDTRVISNSQGQTNDAANVLAKALNDTKVQYIRFASALSITPVQMITLARDPMIGDIVFDGTKSTINGNVTIGKGATDSNIYDLRNLTIKGDLTINLSATGDCKLTNVTITGKKVVINKAKATVADVVIVDDPLKIDKNLYGIGNVIKIGVKFSEPVVVIGKPVLSLSILGDAIYDQANSTSERHIFNYTVKEKDNISSLESIGINLSGGDIQATEGASNISADIVGAASKKIYSSISKKDIIVDGERPSLSTTAIAVNDLKITYIANDLLDKATAEVVGNWNIRIIDATPAGFTDYQPTKVVLQGDNKTVILEMSDSIKTTFKTNFDIGKASVFMTNEVKDKAGNPANDVVLKASGSLGIAWRESIVGLPTGYGYKVIIGTGDSTEIKYTKANGELSSTIVELAELTDKTVTGLTNGETYKVEVVTGLQPQAIVAADKAATNVKCAAGETYATVKTNVTLQPGTNGSTITWTSTNTAISIAGVVVRPIYSDGNKTGTLTAKIEKDSAIDTKAFEITVLKKDFTVMKSTFADNKFTIVGDGYVYGDFVVGDIKFDDGSQSITINGLTYTLAYSNATGVTTVSVSGAAIATDIATTKAITVTKDTQTRKLTLNIPAMIAGTTAVQAAITVTAD